MNRKLLITLNAPHEAQRVREIGCDVVAEYPDSLLVRCTEAQAQQLEQEGLESAEVETPPVQIGTASFAFASAVEANDLNPLAPPNPHRTAYYLMSLVGPAQGEWLNTLRALGGQIQGNLHPDTLIVGIPPAQVPPLAALPWVEGITPYRPAMKVAVELRSVPTHRFTVNELSHLSLDAEGTASPKRQVQISVFSGESMAEITGIVRAAGGVLLGETPQTLTALVGTDTIAELAERVEVQSITPHQFPQLMNDQALPIMGVPTEGTFGTLSLRGQGQIIAITDSGLDTGDPTTMHPDFQGRIVGVVSWPTTTNFASLVHDPPASDNGPADRLSAHGTHVAGSALGSGAVAVLAGSAFVPRGVASEAHAYFQAVEQEVRWKSREELPEDPGPDWPPPASGLYGLPDDLEVLFLPAYQAGARIHTNSWGTSDPSLFRQYDPQARMVDQFCWEHRDMLILFAAGNTGFDSSGDGVIDMGSIAPPGTAKNCLTVGASENLRPSTSHPTPGSNKEWKDWKNFPTMGRAGHVSDQPEGMAPFSSRGPTTEGRIKPDLVAPGTNILSVRSSVFPPDRPALVGDLEPTEPLHGRYCWSHGTSMSTPLVAGAAALVRQYLIEQRQHFVPGSRPSGALIKAFLINGAKAMTGQFSGEIPAGPNPVSGFGRVYLADLLSDTLPSAFADDPDHAVQTGQIRRFQVQAALAGPPLKITLVWTDAPSLPSNGTLENALYLQVRTPNGTILNGDVTPFPRATNNVQQVVIAAPVAGSYEIRVRGVSIVQTVPGTPLGVSPRQDFALVVSNATALNAQEGSRQ